MKKIIYLLTVFLILGCSTDVVDNNTQERGNGKGKKPRVALLTIPDDAFASRLAATNVMLDPVEYTGELPTDDNGGLVDWDNDGLTDDLIVYSWDCYFPRSFAKVHVYIDGTEEILINNSIAYGATLLGFADVDNDGDQDIIWQGGNHYKYNSETFGTSDEVYSPYNVGYNTIAEEPAPLGDLVGALQLTQSDNNPNFIRWDLGQQYEAYVFHVMWYEVDATGAVISPYYQTHTYGEWGIEANYFQPGTSWVIKFSNVADGCEDVFVNFSL